MIQYLRRELPFLEITVKDILKTLALAALAVFLVGTLQFASAAQSTHHKPRGRHGHHRHASSHHHGRHHAVRKAQ
jgi:hypothetical protein